MIEPRVIDLDSDDPTMTLVVGRRTNDHMVGGHVNVAADALEALRGQCDEALEELETSDVKPYDPDTLLEEREVFLIERDEIEDSFGVLALVDAGAEGPLLSPDDIAARPQTFYAAVRGRDPRRRVAFVAKSNPARVVRAGLFLTPSHGVLRRIEDRVFLFEDRVDLIVGPRHLVVFNQTAFEQWFRDTPALQERVGEWIDGIAAHLPIDGDGAARLAARARTDGRLRRVLFSINARGHLERVSIGRISEHIRVQGLDPAAFVVGGRLIIDDADPATVLKILNEDLFLGGLTDEPFVVDRKSRRH